MDLIILNNGTYLEGVIIKHRLGGHDIEILTDKGFQIVDLADIKKVIENIK